MTVVLFHESTSTSQHGLISPFPQKTNHIISIGLVSQEKIQGFPGDPKEFPALHGKGQPWNGGGYACHSSGESSPRPGSFALSDPRSPGHPWALDTEGKAEVKHAYLKIMGHVDQRGRDMYINK